MQFSKAQNGGTVVGAGTYVDWVAGGVGLDLRQSARGHFEVYGGEDYDSRRKTPHT